ncbi:MAG TPA: type II toxin-antitoxin system VapC family toxin [Sphingomonas sp.]|nr:type II toxin-antitoxin system VapC family toxin [Sphingomonas sp.]
MIFLDSNVIIDVLERDAEWFGWSNEQIASAAQDDTVAVSAIVVAECAGRFADLDELKMTFDMLDLIIEDLPIEAAFSAGQLFRNHRRAASDRKKILADFLIGAHADHAGRALITRDTRLYRTYFPKLMLITPETDND